MCEWTKRKKTDIIHYPVLLRGRWNRAGKEYGRKEDTYGKKAAYAPAAASSQRGGALQAAQRCGHQRSYRSGAVSYTHLVAPIDDPEVIVLVALDTPSRTTGTYPSGGNMAAPLAGSLFSQILPYLGIEPTYSSEELAAADANVPNCVGLTLEEAKQRLSENGFSCRTVGSGAEVTDQTPVGGSIVPGTAEIILYLGEEKPTKKCVVPKVIGLSLIHI